MNGKRARNIRKLTKAMTPQLDGRTEYIMEKVDVSVVKRMERQHKYELRRSKKLKVAYDDKKVTARYGDIAYRQVLSGLSRRKYYKINKCRVNGGSNCDKT